jgi:serine/threonine protein kinase
MAANTPKELRYNLTRLDNVEDLEKYRSGGFHPIHLGDALNGGRDRVLHELGYRGFSTVWLARDDDQNRLISLKMLTAEASRHPKEIKLLRHLDEHAQANPWRGSIVTMLDDFTVDGPNGRHLCCVSQVGGPSFSAIADSPGETAGTRRLRAPLARRPARQLAKVVSFMHDVGIVHGGTLNAGEIERVRYPLG